MASVFLKHTTICFVIISLLLFLQCCAAFSTYADEDEEYSVDSPYHFTDMQGGRYQSRKIRKGAHCDLITKNICNRLSVNNGTGVLDCCKTHCRNILRDRNNCGRCGHRCGFGELCCYGTCTNVACNDDHCGKCDKRCLQGVKCEYGTCGYA